MADPACSGFTHFDSRNAQAYRGPFINVVNFQSFSSRDSEALKCTSYSFCVNLGVYVLGSPWEHQLKRDKQGLIRPPEYAGSRPRACKLPKRGCERGDRNGIASWIG